MADTPRDQVTDSEAAGQFLRFREQCFLIKNLDMLQSSHKAKTTRYRKYQDFTPMNGDPFRVIGAFGGLVDNDRLLELTPEQLSVLIPMVKIYKVGKVAKVISPGREIGDHSASMIMSESGVLIPVEAALELGQIESAEAAEVYGHSVAEEVAWEDKVLGEYLFKDYTDTSPERIAQLQMGSRLPGMAGLGHGGVVGLKHFSYEYDGGNPEIPKAGITHLTLEFFFSDIRLLFERGGNGLSFIDLITYRPAAGAGTFKCGNRDVPLQEYYDENHFSIKVVFGWETPGDLSRIPVAAGQSDNDIKRIKQAVKDSQTTLVLNLLRHTFDYHDDGTMSLTIEYIGRNEAMLQAESHDIFWQPTPMKRAIKAVQKQLEDVEKSQTELSNSMSQNQQPDSAATKDLLAKMKKQSSKSVSIKNQLNMMQLKNRRHVYKRLMHYMYERDMIMRFWVEPDDIIAYNKSDTAWNVDAKVSEYYEGGVTYLTAEEQLSQDALGHTYDDRYDNTEGTYFVPPSGLYESEFSQAMRAEQALERSQTPEALEHGGMYWKLRTPSHNKKDARRATSRHSATMEADINGEASANGIDTVMKNIMKDAEQANSAGVQIDLTKSSQLASKHFLEHLGNVQTLELARARGENYSIKFFFFGDLLQAALDIVQGWDSELGDYITGHDTNVSTEQALKDLYEEREKMRKSFNLNIVLGEIRWIDAKGQDRKTNIADLPIAVNTFVTWFNSSVVSELKGSWTLKNFIKSLLSELFPKILGEECTVPEQEASGVNASPNITMTSFYLPKCKGANKRSPNGCIPRPYEKFKTRNLDPSATGQGGSSRAMDFGSRGFDLKDLNYTSYFPSGRLKPARIQHKQTKDIDEILYIYWFAYNRTAGLRGDIERDRKKFINHYYMGADRGMVKSIQFQRNDIQYHREGRILSDSCRESQLREPYDATITLFGNPLIKPGQYIYITPSPFLGRQGYGKLLGMTGYYYVTKVSGEISSGKFETIVKGFWQQYATQRRGKNQTGDAVYIGIEELRNAIAKQRDLENSQIKDAREKAAREALTAPLSVEERADRVEQTKKTNLMELKAGRPF